MLFLKKKKTKSLKKVNMLFHILFGLLLKNTAGVLQNILSSLALSSICFERDDFFCWKFVCMCYGAMQYGLYTTMYDWYVPLVLTLKNRKINVSSRAEERKLF